MYDKTKLKLWLLLQAAHTKHSWKKSYFVLNFVTFCILCLFYPFCDRSLPIYIISHDSHCLVFKIIVVILKVGDNVGDCAARGADLFESIAAEIISAMILGGTMAQRCKIEGT